MKRTKQGRSARTGRAPSPYTKRKKRPFIYPSKDELRKKYPADYTRLRMEVEHATR